MVCLLLRRAAFLGLCLITAALSAAPPSITKVTPNGLTLGQANKIQLDGAALTADAKIITALPITDVRTTGKPTAAKMEFEFQLGMVAPGLYPVRIATNEGISNPLVIAVDTFATQVFTPQISSVPTALVGTLPGPQVLKTSFTGKKDQRIVLDVEAQRIGSNLRPTVRLYDPRGRQIAWSPPRYQVGGDARCEVVLPADGQYAIEIHDQLYKAADPAFFRLKIGDLTYAEATLPLAVRRGTKSSLRPVLSNLTQSFDWEAKAELFPGLTSAALPTDTVALRRPRVLVTEMAEHLHPTSEPLAIPCGLSAVLAVDGGEIEQTINVVAGQKLRFEVQARRFGSPLDAVLTIRNDKGAQLATADDRPGTSDPLLEFVVPKDVSQLKVGVKDMQGRGGPEFFYRLEVTNSESPDFELAIAADRINIPAGGSVIIPLSVTRRNYTGPITLQPTQLPSDIELNGLEIPAGASQALISFTAKAGSNFQGTFSLSASGGDSAQPLRRNVLFAEYPGAKYQPWLRNEAGIAIGTPAPIQLTWQIPNDAKLIAGDRLAVTANLVRQPNVKGDVRLRLVTTQPQPRKKVKEKQQEKEVDDIPRTLRLEESPVFKGDATSQSLALLVPGDLPAGNWDLAFVAELLAADGKVATSVGSPIQRVTSVFPFTLELTGPAKRQGRAGSGDAQSLEGKVLRVPGYTQPALVTLTDLPKDVLPPVVSVPADRETFSLPLRFASGTKPAALKNAKLVALSDPGNPISARSNEVAVTVTLAAGEKPMPEPTQEIFDEDANFAAKLTEGKGQLTVESVEKFAGKISLKINGQSKSQAKIPGMEFKIRENPGPGEYRYLRFAWKKQGGETISLQLGHDGEFGPTSQGRPGASFRYHAGGTGAQMAGSVEIDTKIPNTVTVVTRDLFADFGEFTFTGIGLNAVDGAFAVFDHIHLARAIDDLAGAKKD